MNRGEQFEFRWREGEGRGSLLQAWYYLVPRPLLRCSRRWTAYVAHPKPCADHR